VHELKKTPLMNNEARVGRDTLVVNKHELCSLRTMILARVIAEADWVARMSCTKRKNGFPARIWGQTSVALRHELFTLRKCA
jgi:hypothetical protein